MRVHVSEEKVGFVLKYTGVQKSRTHMGSLDKQL